MKKITVIISKGKTNIVTHGFSGDACQHATLKLEKALGETQHEELTDEYYAENNQTQDQ